MKARALHLPVSLVISRTGIHTPFIVRWPGKIKLGTVSGAMISFADITPTFVDAAGVAPNPDLDGRSFLGVLLGKAKDWMKAQGDKVINNPPVEID